LTTSHPRATRRDALRAAAAGMAAALAGSRAFAQASGAQPVKLIVPFTPGTTPDLCARLLGPQLQGSLKRTFIVDNRAGASGMIGMDAVTKSPPDGSVLMFGTSTALTLPLVYAKVPFDVLTGFTPVTLIGYTNFGLVVHPSVPARTIKDLKAYAAAQADPLSYGSPGKGTFQHLCTELIAYQTDMRLNHVPYKGSGPALADLLGGHVKLMVLPLHVAMPLVADGKLTMIGSTRKERDAAHPTVTPLAEAGVPGLDADAWYAVWGPAAMNAATVSAYHDAIAQALGEADVRQALQKMGVTSRPSTPEQLARLSELELAKWTQLVKDIKLAPE